MTLKGKKSYYLLVSAFHHQQDDYTNNKLSQQLEGILYLKGYQLVKLGNGSHNIAYLAYNNEDHNQLESLDCNNNLRYDAIELMDQFYQDSIIVKYINEDQPKKIMKDGSERPTKLVDYNGDLDNSYYNEGISFSFLEMEEYFKPTKKSDFKEGMIVEIKNNHNYWVPREVVNVNEEWEKLYSVLIKYDRVRCLKDI